MNKPFIKLLNNAAGKYAYDINSNCLLKLSSEQYAFLYNMICGDDFNNGSNDFVSTLQKMGLLLPNYVLNCEKYSSEVLEYAVDHCLHSLLLQVTRNCNLRCKYCFYSGKYIGIRNHENKKMTQEMAVKIIDFFVSRSKRNETVNIGFYGGEPLLNFALIRNVVEYIAVKYKDIVVNYSITTNGTLLTDEIIKFFIKYNFKITVSIDGPQKMHDLNRVYESGDGSFNIVYNNLGKIRRLNNDFFVGNVRYNAVSTVDTSAVESFFKNDSLLCGLSGKISRLNAYHKSTLTNLTIKNDGVDRLDYDSIRAQIKRWRKMKENGEIDEIKRKLSFETKECPVKTASVAGLCIPGVSRLFVTYDGRFYMCEKIDDDSNELCIGNVNDGWNYDNISMLANTHNTSANGCKNCWAIHLCNMCAAKIVALSADSIDDACEKIRNGLEYKLNRMLEMGSITKVKNVEHIQ